MRGIEHSGEEGVGQELGVQSVSDQPEDSEELRAERALGEGYRGKAGRPFSLHSWGF